MDSLVYASHYDASVFLVMFQVELHNEFYSEEEYFSSLFTTKLMVENDHRYQMTYFVY